MPIRNYGLKWKWSSSMYSGSTEGMWGRKSTNSEPVNLRKQIGIYTLERRGRIVYVGKAGTAKKMSIWDRMYSHHYEKKDKWDTFSWFGILPVKSNRVIKMSNVTMPTSLLISDIEALLIHLLHPKLNIASGRSEGSPGETIMSKIVA